VAVGQRGKGEGGGRVSKQALKGGVMIIVSAAEMRRLDQITIQHGTAGHVLMERAGQGATAALLRWFPHVRKRSVVICAGKGNNGGDGFVMARHLELHDVETSVLLFCDPAELAGDAATNYHVLAASKQRLDVLGKAPDRAALEQKLSAADWIVDALLGTGTQGLIREPYITAITAINDSGKKAFSVDLPSGMDCDTGQPLGACVRADHTATFVARKVGFDAAGAQELTGQVHVVGIGVPQRLLDSLGFRL
jgi:NAD(P)H-hydrate epimerase